MKKYQQLILIATAVIGTAFFIFYKHEYNRLRAVLQALDTFGTDDNNVDPAKTCINKHTCTPINPPQWRQIGNVYFYGAFVIQPSRIDVMSVGVSFTDVKKECLIWSEHEPRIPWSERDTEPTSGETTIDYLDTDGTNHVVVIKCTAEGNLTKIFGVTISVDVRGETYGEFIATETTKNAENTKEIAICTLINEKPFTNSLQIAEFIEFHRLVGATHFYLYSDALAPNVKRFLDQYGRKSSTRINIVNWNPPVTLHSTASILNSIYFNDCLIRSRLVADYVAILNVSQLFMPYFHEKLQNIMRDVEESDSKPRAYLQFYSKMFCLDYANDPHAQLPLISLQKTWWQKLETDVRFSLINNRLSRHIASDFKIVHDPKFRSYLMPSDVAVLHKYNECKGVNDVLKHENVAQKFARRLISDGLIKLAMKNE